eukprot:Pgem_evm1s9613
MTWDNKNITSLILIYYHYHYTYSLLACHAKSIKPSAILLSIGIPENIARNAIRVSMDRNSKEADIIRAAELIAKSSRALDIQ